MRCLFPGTYSIKVGGALELAVSRFSYRQGGRRLAIYTHARRTARLPVRSAYPHIVSHDSGKFQKEDHDILKICRHTTQSLIHRD